MNILSLDGGGVYGAHTIVVIKKILEKQPDFLNKVDIFAGTSIGGIIALALAKGEPAQNVLDFIAKKSKTIFSSSLVRNAKSSIGTKAYYNNIGMHKVLKEAFGTTKLSELNKKVIIQSFDIAAQPGWKEKVFHNFTEPKTLKTLKTRRKCTFPPSGDVTLVDAAMATASAPVYFPSYGTFIDGGVTQNNPAMQAIAFTQDKSLEINNRPNLDEIKLFSIGRVYHGYCLTNGSDLDWGYINWIGPLISILLTGNTTSVDYQCKQFLGDKYHRIEHFIPEKLSLDVDSVNIIPELITFSEQQDYSKSIDWVQKNWL